jgi:penicillin-binding protein 1C
LKRHLRELEGRNVEDGAVVVLDNATGEVLAYVGSSGELSRAGEVDGAARPGQGGLDAEALPLFARHRGAAPHRRVDPRRLAAGGHHRGGLYVPQNYDRSFRGPVTLRHALAGLPQRSPRSARWRSSAARRCTRACGAWASTPWTADAAHYGYGLALGGAEVNALQLANAYRALANGGRFGPVTFDATSPPGAVRGWRRRPGRLLPAAMVRGPIRLRVHRRARCLHRGGHPRRPRRACNHVRVRRAARHAIPREREDRDQQGHARQLGRRASPTRTQWSVWVGNFSGAPMHDVSGVSGAAPVWRT